MSLKFFCLHFCFVVVLFAGGCFTDASITNEMTVTCDSDNDCPDNRVCRLGRCLSAADAVKPAPTLKQPPVISPLTINASTAVRISFDVEGELGGNPVVRLNTGTSLVLLTSDNTQTNFAAGHFEYTYLPDGTELQGARPITLDLQGKFGANANNLAAGSVIFDFFAPQLEGLPDVAPTLASLEVVTLTFRLNEIALGIPQVFMRPRGAPSAQAFAWVVTTDSFDPLSHEAEYSPTGGEPNVEYDIFISASDLAGNTSVPDFAGRVTLDFAAPQPLGVEVRYQSDVNNPLFAVGSLRNGTKVVVTFETNEPIQLVPTPELQIACPGDTSLVVSRRSGETSSTFFSFEYVLSGSDNLDDGVCSLATTLRDAANNINQSDLLAQTIVIDRTPPPPLEQSELDLLLHLRVPWGATRTSGLASQYLAAANVGDADPLSVDLADAAFDSPVDTIVEGRIYGDSNATQLLGITRFQGAGWSPVRLSGVDASAIWITRIDHAGNESLSQRLGHVAWVSTLGGKVAYTEVGNPHRFERSAAFVPTPLQSTSVDAGEDAGMASFSDFVVTDLGEPQINKLTKLAAVPPNPWGTLVAAYDRARNTIVAYTNTGVLWEWKDRWRQKPITDPELDGNPVLVGPTAYDDSHKVVYLLDQGPIGSTRLWEWNGVSWRARNTVGGPGFRSGAGLVYDASQQRLILYGGSDGGSVRGDLWQWDGDTWALLCDPSSVSAPCSAPPGRWIMGIAYDRSRERIVVFGGAPDVNVAVCGSIAACGDTWEWDVNTHQWNLAQAHGLPGQPANRADMRLVYDEIRQRTVMFGGFNSSSVPLNDIWEWDGVTWSLRQPIDPENDGRSPGARYGHAMVYDSRRGVTTVVSGVGISAGDVWEWNGVSWRNVTPAVEFPDGPFVPSEGDGVRNLVYDTRRQRVVALTSNAETWEFDGVRLIRNAAPME